MVVLEGRLAELHFGVSMNAPSTYIHRVKQRGHVTLTCRRVKKTPSSQRALRVTLLSNTLPQCGQVRPTSTAAALRLRRCMKEPRAACKPANRTVRTSSVRITFAPLMGARSATPPSAGAKVGREHEMLSAASIDNRQSLTGTPRPAVQPCAKWPRLGRSSKAASRSSNALAALRQAGI
jgi:hypothetical protein